MATDEYGWRYYIHYDVPADVLEVHVFRRWMDGRRDHLSLGENGVVTGTRFQRDEGNPPGPFIRVQREYGDSALRALAEGILDFLGDTEATAALKAKLAATEGARDIAVGTTDKLLGIVERKLMAP